MLFRSAYTLTTAGLKSLEVIRADDFPDDAAPLPLGLRHLQLFFDGPISTKTFRVLLHQSKHTLETLGLHVPNDGDSLSSTTSLVRLARYLAKHPLRALHSISITEIEDITPAKELLTAVPSLTSIDIEILSQPSIDVVGECATKFLQTLTFPDCHTFTPAQIDPLLNDLTRIMQRPNLEGLERLELPRLPKEHFEREAGRALLEEGEKGSISVLSIHGFM